MCNLNVIVVLEFKSRDLYLLFAIRFSSKFQNSVFYRHMRPESGLKFPRPLLLCALMIISFKGLYSDNDSVLLFTTDKNHKMFTEILEH